MTTPTDPAPDDKGRPTSHDLLSRAQQWADQHAGDRVPFTHEDTIPWDRMRLPRRFHRCWVQSWGSCGPFEMVERCPCGATRLDGGPWLHKNSRRTSQGGIGPSSTGENVGDGGLALIKEMRAALREGKW